PNTDPILHYANVTETLHGSEDDIDRVRYRVEHAVIIAMAGALALKRYNPRSNWRYSGSGAEPGEFLLKGSADQWELELIGPASPTPKVAWMSFGTKSMNLSLAVSTTTGMGLRCRGGRLVQSLIEILPFQIRVGREGLGRPGVDALPDLPLLRCHLGAKLGR